MTLIPATIKFLEKMYFSENFHISHKNFTFDNNSFLHFLKELASICSSRRHRSMQWIKLHRLIDVSALQIASGFG